MFALRLLPCALAGGQGEDPSEYKKTIATDYYETNLTVDGIPTRLQLWDTAGQKEFDNIRQKKLKEKENEAAKAGGPGPLPQVLPIHHHQ